MVLGVASSSMAVSLGRSSGATLIGRPLDITVQASLEGDNTQACLEAEVFYADERIDRARVRTSLERVSPTGQDASIRIRVARPVDEPVVTVYLRAGCVQRTERRYVLLADVATDQASVARPMDLNVRPATEEPATARRPVPVTASAPATDRRLPEPAAGASATGGTTVRRPDPVPRVRRAAAPQAPARPSARLTLEPIDLSVETFPSLRASSEMLAVPATSPEQRAQAAALWTALSTQPEDVLAAAAKLAAIEAAVQGLQLETRKNQAAVTELGVALQSARDARYANGLVYGLLAALVLALAGLAYVWRRPSGLRPAAPSDTPWWNHKAPADTDWHSALGPIASDFAPHTGDSESSLPAERAEKAVRAGPPPMPRAAPGRRAVPSRVPPLSRRDQADFGLSMPHTPSRAAKAEELFDIQHQAEFFVSIGQENRAIDILLDHIDDDLPSSAQIYLDLLDLYHRLDREADYAELADSFKRLFNAQIPAFEAYAGAAGQGRGLESYAAPLANIRSAWPRPVVLTIMEAMIFRSSERQGERFDPEAFRDLLVLYGVARELVDAQVEAPALLSDFDLSASSPARDSRAATPAARGSPALATADADALPVIEDPLKSAHGLDIDLEALGGAGTASPVRSGVPPPAPVLVEPAPGSAAPAPLAPLLDFELLSLQPLEHAADKGGSSP
jgi:hypothetical protein